MSNDTDYDKHFISLARKAYQIIVMRGYVHELNNYLTGILGYSQLILECFELDDSLHEHIKDIESSAQRSRDAIKQMSKLWKFYNREITTVDFKAIIKDIIAGMKYYTERKSLDLTLNTDEKELFLQCFEEDIQDAFFLLISGFMMGSLDGNAIVINIFSEKQEIRVSFNFNNSQEMIGRLNQIYEMVKTGKKKKDGMDFFYWAFCILLIEIKGELVIPDNKSDCINVILKKTT